GVTIAPMSATEHALVLLKAAIVTLSWVLTFFAIKHLPISLASPVRASAPLFTLFGAILLFGERPHWQQWVGIGCVLLAYSAFSWIGRSEGIHFEKNRWVWSLFAGTLVGAVSGLYDKHLLQGKKLEATTLQFWFSIYNALLQGAIVAALWRPRRQRSTPYVFRWSMLAVAALLLLADNLYFRALALPGALVSIVSTTRRANVVISFAVGGFVFQERYRAQKSVALLGVLVGLALLLR
ncbi:MAG TPA: DMT family transporter, partial [Polyangiaceae bacterium]|nr:DMT family transporter [Polyangiaceae bacterium]